MIRQRILYVGIGGSGLDLGIKLDEALRREICGLDGRALLRKGGPFASLKPNQLPNFVQSLYIDFASESLESVTSSISGGNAVAARNLVPTINNYPSLATELRLRAPETTRWVPPSSGEPSTQPLSGGAGQFPTVGRAALFQSIRAQGYKTAIGDDIDKALNSLDKSLGELGAFTGNNSVSDVAIYVGFSMSGGTGCGIFLDVLQMLMHEVHRKLLKTNVTVLPVVMLPSTFDGLLPPDNERRAKLNAARALLDLTELVEHMQAPNPDPAKKIEFSIKYPDTSLGNSGAVSIDFLDNPPIIPVITLVSKPSVMDRSDIARSVAASIVAQSSSMRPSKTTATEITGAVKNVNSFIEDLINLIPTIQQQHETGLGTLPLMPMMSSSLTLPARRIADVVSRQLVAEGLEAMSKAIALDSAAEEEIDRMLGDLGFNDFISPETFSSDTNLNFVPRSMPSRKSDLDVAINRLRGQIAAAMPIIEKQIASEVNKKTVFKALDGLRLNLKSKSSGSSTNLPSAIHTLFKTLNKLETNRGSEVGGGRPKVSGAKKSRKPILPKRLSSTESTRTFNIEEDTFKAAVRNKWWSQWYDSRASWTNSLESGRSRVNELKRLLDDFVLENKSRASGDLSELSEERVGVIIYVPTQGRPINEAIKQIVLETADRIRADKGINDLSPEALLQNLLDGDEDGGWEMLVERFSKNLPKNQIHDAILDPVRRAVENAMAGSEERTGTLPPLGRVLADAANSGGETHSDLIAKLGSLVPGGLVPSGSYKRAKILVSYPGNKNEAVESLITQQLKLAGPLRQVLVDTNILFTPTGDSDVLTVNMNMIGQGLLDNPETREILQRWNDAVNSTKDEQVKWRQRKGYENIHQIFGGQSQVVVFNGLLRGLFGGLIELESGTPNSPDRLIVKNSDGAQHDLARVIIDIPQLPGHSSWPNLIRAFEQMVLGIDNAQNFQGFVVSELVKYLPPILFTQEEKVPEIVKALLSQRAPAIASIEEALKAGSSKYGDAALRNLRSAHDFWTTAVPRAMDFEINNSPNWKTLGVALSETDPNFKWR